MAFVSRAERRLDITQKSPSNVGPGAYIGPKYYKPAHSCAPFTSTTERDIHKLFGTNYTPGPGSYALTPASAPNPKSTSHIDSTSIQRALAPFATGSERFKAKNSDGSPGPGSYNLPSNWNNRKNSSKKTEWANVSWMRMPSAPSIPSHNQIFGYEELPNGELVMQKNPEKVYTGAQGDTVGPGHYEVKNLEALNAAKGTQWGKSTSKKGLQVKSTTAATIGPGSYSEAQLNISPMYKFKPSAVFMSGMKPAKQRKRDQEEEESSGEEGIPGPGYYHNESVTSAFAPKTQPRHLQFFGGKSERFKNNKKEFNVGPGQYDADVNLPANKSGESKAPFASTKVRFTYKTDEIPGPGQYEEPKLTEDLKKKVWGRHGVFGSTEKRFAAHKTEEELPGPGHYPPDAHKRIGIHNSAMRKPSSVFVSKTKRDVKIESVAPAPGSYEIKSTIGAVKQPGASRVPVLTSSPPPDKKKVGFNAQSDRFKSSLPAEPAIGPGHYNSSAKNSSTTNVILPKSKRFSSEKPKEQTPGPGTYQEENDVWVKKSYNVIFSDIN